jgi:malate dehydrogenase (oxaloacetate-decarboxylating)
MLDFRYIYDPQTKQNIIETTFTGKQLLNTTLLNKGTAFSYEERCELGLLGKLPERIETLEEQVARTYGQLNRYKNKLNRFIFLSNLQDMNETLFYRLASDYLAELLPIIYTPMVGTAVQEHSREFRQPRGLYISYPDRDRLDEILDNRTHPDVELLVMTDGEGVLGIGDQGIGAMDIPIAKLIMYTLCGGINPAKTLPIHLDVGTNNLNLLNDPYYLGWRNPRISGKEYDDFIEKVVNAVQRKFPSAFLHWEDLGRDNARRVLVKYREKICTFNDDIQGTGVVALAGLMSAAQATGVSLAQQRFVIFGAGTAGMGIAEQIVFGLLNEGVTLENARRQIWLVDRQGLLTDNMGDELTEAQRDFARPAYEVSQWNKKDSKTIDLYETVRQVKPTALIGCSAVPSAFNEEIVKEMMVNCPLPIIFPLSNPTERSEATPQDLMKWTNGRVLIATGSPFEIENSNGQKVLVAQSNNALAFPAIGLAVIASKAQKLTDNMLWAACKAIASVAPVRNMVGGSILPSIIESRNLRAEIAKPIMRQAIEDGVCDLAPDANLDELIAAVTWEPKYLPIRKKECKEKAS